MSIIGTHTHIYKIKKLIQEYCELEPGFLIRKHEEILKVSNNPKVYISRRALKHFVERRKEEMKYKSNIEILKRLYFIIDRCEQVLYAHDSLNQEKSRSVYAKFYEYELNASIRIVVEKSRGIRLIVSIHIQKYKKATD